MAIVAPDSYQSDFQSKIRGDVYFDEMTRGIYATDASHYQITPSVVVCPRDEQDAIQAVAMAGRHGLPITARGGGTSLSGQTTWTGLVLDFSKYMDQVVEVNEAERWVRAQPGVIRDRLNSQLAAAQLHFAPDPATGNRATIGGMIGNNTSGTRSIVYGKTIDNVLECRVVLADGTVLDLRPTDYLTWEQLVARGTREGEIYRRVRDLIHAQREEIERRFPKVMRRVGGYNLDAFLSPDQGGQPGDWNLANLIIGSEGTLGVLLEAKLRLQPNPAATALCVVQFRSLGESLRSVEPMLAYSPSTVELLDSFVIREARRNPTTRQLTDFLNTEADAILIVEMFGDSVEHAAERIRGMVDGLRSEGIGFDWTVRTDAAGQSRVWEVRKLGLGLIANAPGARKGQAFIEDACVPIPVLAKYAEQVFEICKRHGVPITVYAHASVGVLHFRPMLDLHDPEDVARMRKIAYEAFELVKEYGGSWSGEHGDGLLRGEFTPKFFGPVIYEAFREVKRLFDPQGIMNPGKIIDSPPMTEHLRYGASYQPRELPTEFHYRDQGGFVLAVEQCAGVGACRKVGAGTMCPSYMATRDEEHTTRGRANALRLAMSGQLGDEALTSDRMHDVLKLCLSCKACKTECPTSVDMSRLKSEVLSMRHARMGTPWSNRVLGNAPMMAAIFAGPLAGIFNWTQQLTPFRWLLQRVVGIDRRRPLPQLHPQPLTKWFRNRTSTSSSTSHQGNGHPRPSSRGKVALFIDTFTNYYEPHIGIAATELLESCGYEVQPAAVGCCQRPQISKGLLKQAKRDGLATLQGLDRFAAAGTPILVLEPSCASSLIDDLGDLVRDVALGERVAEKVRLVDQFLAEERRGGRLDEVTFYASSDRMMIHGHCHQKAMFGTQTMKELLGTVDGLEFSEIDAGCCGMAGSFGYEQYDLSHTIGEDRLFPAVRERDDGTEVIACGISCRHQLHDFLDVKARHWVEVVRARRSIS